MPNAFTNQNIAALTNEQILDSIGFPADFLDTLRTLQGNQYVAKSNEFLSALVNKILYQRVLDMDFTNPFSKYDSFPIEMGDTIENIYVQLVRGYKFDKDADDPFKKVNPEVVSAYVSINYEMQYCITIQDVLLRRAALSTYGLTNLVEKLLRSVVVALNVDEYLANIIMLNNAELYANSVYDAQAQKYSIEELDVSDKSSDTEKYAAIAEKIIDVYTDMLIPSPDYNKRGVFTVSSKKNLLLIIKRSILNKINLEYLTGVYNLDKVDLLSNILQVRDFRVAIRDYNQDPIVTSEDGEDIAFIILDTTGFDNHQALRDDGMIYNPKGKYTNHFANNWKILSYRTDCQAVAYKVKLVPDNTQAVGE